MVSLLANTAHAQQNSYTWQQIYTPLGEGHFKRAPVVTGNMLPNTQQEVVSGIKPGDQVVSNALDLQNTVEQ
jgi:cobalt-zinc-cadmium efflux system membrane fusion protein